MAHSEEEKAQIMACQRKLYPSVREEDREKELELRMKLNSLGDQHDKIESILVTRNLSGRGQRLLAREMCVLYWKMNRLTDELEKLNHSERRSVSRAGRIYIVVSNDGERARLECGDTNPEWTARNPAHESESQFLVRLPVGSKWPITDTTRKQHIQQLLPSIISKEYRELTRLQRKADESE
jgi:hypothetical protein